MEGDSFDRLARRIAGGASRRSLLRSPVALFAASVADRLNREAGTDAAASPFPSHNTQTPPGQPSQNRSAAARARRGKKKKCKSGTRRCGKRCVNTSNDPAHCGACDSACFASETCVSGECLVKCEGSATDPANCGACGNACALGETCVAGACVVQCGGAICRYANARATCVEDSCTLGACRGTWGNCDGDPASGCETDTMSDVDNCGRCGTRCSRTNGTATCMGGECRVVCDDGYANCDHSAYTGCEIDLRTDPENCGACGKVCMFPNAGGDCIEGVCVLGACSDKRYGEYVWGNCDGDPATGCETDIMNDSAHCGGCGQACSDGKVCFNGVCELPCEAGGPCRVFITATVSTGNLGGVAGADEECQNRAEGAHLPGTYMAWISDDASSPSARFLLKSNGPYWLVDRSVVANNWADLTDGSLATIIFVTETGFFPGQFLGVWTHTRPDGTAGGVGDAHCRNWHDAGAKGDYGWSGMDDSTWTENNVSDCFLLRRLYCFQQSG